ncbi:hypothetical protein F5Y14DRAFT_449898 [Nemania sp. NC0429]|nr:hypothetical protein F5Y14DRAFT_449898 [Nemania sp. NC0429]
MRRKHVDNCITPYGCIFEECSQPTTMYISAKEWIAHMEQHHSGVQWVCYGCSPFEPRVFVSRQDYLRHFRTTRQHEGEVDDSHLLELAKFTMIPAPLNFTGCPLCRWSRYTEPYSILPTTIQDHIARHLHAFSLRSLPASFADPSSELSNASVIVSGLYLDSLYYDDLSIPETISSRGIRKSQNDDEDLSTEQDWSYISNGGDLGNEPPQELITKWMSAMDHSSRSTPSSVDQESDSSGTSKEHARRMPAKLCQFCEAIADFFCMLDFDLEYKEFSYYDTERDIYLSARSGCPLCREFNKSIAERSEAVIDLSRLENDGMENSRFAVFFKNTHQNRTLELRDVSDPASCTYKFELYCDRTASAKLLRWSNYRSQFQNFASTGAIDFIKNRLSLCRQSHDKCRADKASRPSRLLDLRSDGFIDTVRLVTPTQVEGPPVDFAFLSAAWGPAPAFRLTAQSWAEAVKGIMLEELPRTIRDAVHVTRSLGLQYLWVDSLCIFQDSTEDWKLEVSMIPSYLSGSAITLAASSSSSLSDGFLSPIETRPSFVFPMNNIENSSDLEIFLRPALPSAWDSLHGDPLMKRLWCLPEMILSPRVIHFGFSRLVWGCATTTNADDSETDTLPMWREHLKLDRPLISETITRMSAVYEMWHTIISYASRLRTTFIRDRLPALSGLASMTASKLGTDIYLAGLWQKNLVRDLLWRRESDPLRRLDTPYPSWTWAAYSGSITFRLLSADFQSTSCSSTRYSDQGEWEPCKPDKGLILDHVEAKFMAIAEIAEVVTFSESENPFLEGRVGILHLRTFYLPYAGIDELFGETLTLKQAMLDVPQNWCTTLGDACFAILGCCRDDLPMRQSWYGLLLAKCEDSDDYVRHVPNAQHRRYREDDSKNDCPWPLQNVDAVEPAYEECDGGDAERNGQTVGAVADRMSAQARFLFGDDPENPGKEKEPLDSPNVAYYNRLARNEYALGCIQLQCPQNPREENR